MKNKKRTKRESEQMGAEERSQLAAELRESTRLVADEMRQNMESVFESARRRHTGSHPITETTCDGPDCWCQPWPFKSPDAAVQDELGAALRRGAAVDAAIAAERERCIKICDQFPKNLMAEHIAKQIRSGQ